VADTQLSHASLLADFNHLSLSATSSRGVTSVRHQRRNALTEGEFRAAFPSSEDLQRLRNLSLQAMAEGKGASAAGLHDQLAGINLSGVRGVDEGRHMFLRSQRRSLPSTSSLSLPPPTLQRGRRRGRRRSGGGGAGEDHRRVASVKLHRDLLAYRLPDVLPRSILQRRPESPQQARNHHQLVLYQPPASIVDEILSNPTRRPSRRSSAAGAPGDNEALEAAT